MIADHFQGIGKFEADLWKIADNLRANSNLASNEYFMGYLKEREGQSFALRTVAAKLTDGCDVEAITPIYEGPNVIEGRTRQQLLAIILAAHGTSGSCSEYVRSVAEQLAARGIEDPAVSELWKALKAALCNRASHGSEH